MGWLPWTWNEVEPPPRTGPRQVSPRILVQRQTEARIAEVEKEHQELVELQERQKQDHKEQEKRKRNAPQYQAEEQRRQWLQTKARLEKEAEEQRRQWLQEKARLEQEAQEKRARTKECRTNMYNALFDFLQKEEAPRHKASEIVDEAWRGAVERLERRKKPMCDELFDDLLEAVDTELVDYHDLYMEFNRAENDAHEVRRKRMYENWKSQ